MKPYFFYTLPNKRSSAQHFMELNVVLYESKCDRKSPDKLKRSSFNNKSTVRVYILTG